MTKTFGQELIDSAKEALYSVEGNAYSTSCDSETCITIKLNTDVLNGFKDQEEDWQTHINRVLQAYYNSHRN